MPNICSSPAAQSQHAGAHALAESEQLFREAVTKNEVDKVRQLLTVRRTIPIDDPVLGNEPALHLAIKRGWAGLVNVLLEFKVRSAGMEAAAHHSRPMSTQ